MTREPRGARLLRLGSGDGAEGPRVGFEARLHARIAASGALALEPVSWANSLGRVARPAFAIVAIVTAATAAMHFWDRSRGDGDDLALLAEGDPTFVALLDGNVDDLLAGPGAAAETPGTVP